MEATTNFFNEGMVADMHPLTTKLTLLTDALNATLITNNGNEFMLLNDMGNTRIQDATTGEVMLLREGFIPVGMKEHGGILYIASVKLDKDEENNPIVIGEIGTIPSPIMTTTEKDSKDETTRTITLNTPVKISDYKLSAGEKYVVALDLYDNSTPNKSIDDTSLIIKLKIYKSVNTALQAYEEQENPFVSSWKTENNTLKYKEGLYKVTLKSESDYGFSTIDTTDEPLSYCETSNSVTTSPYWFINKSSISLDKELMNDLFRIYPGNIPSGKLHILVEKEGIVEDSFKLMPRQDGMNYPFFYKNLDTKTGYVYFPGFMYKTNSGVYINRIKPTVTKYGTSETVLLKTCWYDTSESEFVVGNIVNTGFKLNQDLTNTKELPGSDTIYYENIKTYPERGSFLSLYDSTVTESYRTQYLVKNNQIKKYASWDTSQLGTTSRPSQSGMFYMELGADWNQTYKLSVDYFDQTNTLLGTYEMIFNPSVDSVNGIITSDATVESSQPNGGELYYDITNSDSKIAISEIMTVNPAVYNIEHNVKDIPLTILTQYSISTTSNTENLKFTGTEESSENLELTVYKTTMSEGYLYNSKTQFNATASIKSSLLTSIIGNYKTAHAKDEGEFFAVYVDLEGTGKVFPRDEGSLWTKLNNWPITITIKLNNNIIGRINTELVDSDLNTVVNYGDDKYTLITLTLKKDFVNNPYELICDPLTFNIFDELKVTISGTFLFSGYNVLQLKERGAEYYLYFTWPKQHLFNVYSEDQNISLTNIKGSFNNKSDYKIKYQFNHVISEIDPNTLLTTVKKAGFKSISYDATTGYTVTVEVCNIDVSKNYLTNKPETGSMTLLPTDWFSYYGEDTLIKSFTNYISGKSLYKIKSDSTENSGITLSAGIYVFNINHKSVTDANSKITLQFGNNTIEISPIKLTRLYTIESSSDFYFYLPTVIIIPTDCKLTKINTSDSCVFANIGLYKTNLNTTGTEISSADIFTYNANHLANQIYLPLVETYRELTTCLDKSYNYEVFPEYAYETNFIQLNNSYKKLLYTMNSDHQAVLVTSEQIPYSILSNDVKNKIIQQ